MFKLMALATLLFSTPFYVGAGTSYNYSYYQEVIHSAPGMTFATYINAQTLGTTLSSPEDLVVFNNTIYMIDSKTEAIVVIDEDFNLLEEHTVFPLTEEYKNTLTDDSITEYTLDSPLGIDVTENGIFIADTGNYRILKLNHDFEVVDMFYEIEDDTFRLIDDNPVTEADATDFIETLMSSVESGDDIDAFCQTYFVETDQTYCEQGFYFLFENYDMIIEYTATNMGDHYVLDFQFSDDYTYYIRVDLRYDDTGEIILRKYSESVYFEPAKITVDPTDRMYVVAKNVYEGILEINSDGSFNRFTGVNPIALTPFEIFKRSVMTEEQLSQLKLYLPTEYTNVSIDDRNFIYATSRPSENSDDQTVQLINPKGVDVIKRNGYFPPKGDIHYVEGMNNYVVSGPSDLVDIASTKYGIYTVLDQKRSRLFTYDSEGNLLYINGDEGSQSDKFSEGVAIAYFKDDLLILDRSTKTIVVYRLTEFGSYVNEAIMYHHEGQFEQAAEVWQKVIQINTNYEIAYNGIGKLLLRQEEYKEAMEYFRLGHDQYYYSKAFKEYRNELLKANFGWITAGIILTAGTAIGLRIRKTYKEGGSILYED